MRTLLQPADLFFIDKESYHRLNSDLKGTIVLPKKEFKMHSDYNNIHANCCYEIWNMTYDYVLACPENWYEEQMQSIQTLLLNQQANNHSGMVKGNQLITITYWKSLNEVEQLEMIRAEDDEVAAIELQLFPEKFQKVHGIFPEQHGANCFAAAMYGVTGNEFILRQWMHQETFKLLLERNEMKETEKVESGAVITFADDVNLQHACYMIDDQYCFNKSGQLFYNPWHITEVKNVIEEWKGYKVQIYK